jgi:hypothetical protein
LTNQKEIARGRVGGPINTRCPFGQSELTVVKIEGKYKEQIDYKHGKILINNRSREECQ